jgi:hypothetical protein
MARSAFENSTAQSPVWRRASSLERPTLQADPRSSCNASRPDPFWDARCRQRRCQHVQAGLHVVGLPFLNPFLIISAQHRNARSGCLCENWKSSPLRPGGGFWIYPGDGASDMQAGNLRPEANPLFAFTLAIAGAFIVGLPMAVAIIWICS